MEIMKERTHSGEDFMGIKYFLIGNQITPEITLNVSEAPFGDTLGGKSTSQGGYIKKITSPGDRKYQLTEINMMKRETHRANTACVLRNQDDIYSEIWLRSISIRMSDALERINHYYSTSVSASSSNLPFMLGGSLIRVRNRARLKLRRGAWHPKGSTIFDLLWINIANLSTKSW